MSVDFSLFLVKINVKYQIMSYLFQNKITLLALHLCFNDALISLNESKPFQEEPVL